MATLMGVVSRVVGEVFAVASDGTRRSLLEGDRVFAGERLITGVSGAVAVTLPDGREVTLGRDSSTLLDGQWVTSADTPPAGTPANEPDAPPSQAELTDVERLPDTMPHIDDLSAMSRPVRARPCQAITVPRGAWLASGVQSVQWISRSAQRR